MMMKVEVEAPAEEMIEDESSAESEKKELYDGKCNADEESIRHLLKQQTLFEQQQEDILVICS